MIAIENINKYYGKLHVLQDINLQLRGGQCVAFVGPNGCGKTTLMKTILGLVKPQSGKILVEGVDINTTPKCREHIGFMPQYSCFPSNMTVNQTIETIKNVRQYHGELDLDLYRAYDIDSFASKRTNALSGGMGQKVNAALAFLFSPQILILDEPTASLDPIAADILKEKIRKEKAKGKLIFITSHILSELDDLVSHIIFMEEGKILLYNSVDELLAQTNQTSVTKAVMNILKQSEHETDC